jgi:hypothetical protein
METTQEEIQTLIPVQDSFWTEMLFAWGTLAVAISLALIVYVEILAVGYPAYLAMLPAGALLLLLLGAALLIRHRQQRSWARYVTASRHTETESLVSALKRLSSEDRQRVIRRVFQEHEGTYDLFLEQEHRIRRFGLYLLGCSVFVIAVLELGYSALPRDAVGNALLKIALIISAALIVEMLLNAIRQLHMRAAERKLKHFLGFA